MLTNMKLGLRLPLLFLAVGIIPFVIIGYVSTSTAEKAFKNQR